MSSVAIIIGGASGMGYGVAKSLAQKGWIVHIADLNEEAAAKAAVEVGGTHSQTNVGDYQSLRSMFESVYEKYGEINFVFANAGIGEKISFYELSPDNKAEVPPAELDKIISIDLASVINTAYLAKYYMLKNQTKGKACIILNASIAGIYPVKFCPIYTAAKHGVVGFARAISQIFYEDSGIRVNTLCPGNVRTNLFRAEEWDVFKMEWIEVAQIVKIVEMMLFDESMQGKIIEAAPKKHYEIEIPPYKDDNVRLTLEEPTVHSLGR